MSGLTLTFKVEITNGTCQSYHFDGLINKTYYGTTLPNF